MDGSGGWDVAYARAQAFVKQLTLLEKVNLTTGVGYVVALSSSVLSLTKSPDGRVSSVWARTAPFPASASVQCVCKTLR